MPWIVKFNPHPPLPSLFKLILFAIFGDLSTQILWIISNSWEPEQKKNILHYAASFPFLPFLSIFPHNWDFRPEKYLPLIEMIFLFDQHRGRIELEPDKDDALLRADFIREVNALLQEVRSEQDDDRPAEGRDPESVASMLKQHERQRTIRHVEALLDLAVTLKWWAPPLPSLQQSWRSSCGGCCCLLAEVRSACKFPNVVLLFLKRNPSLRLRRAAGGSPFFPNQASGSYLNQIVCTYVKGAARPWTSPSQNSRSGKTRGARRVQM